MKKQVSLLRVAILSVILFCLLSVSTVSANPEPVTPEKTIPVLINSGQFSNSGTWEFYNDGSLYLHDSGVLPDYNSEVYTPWTSYRDQITAIYLDNDITGIGSNTFRNTPNLRWLYLPDKLTEIQSGAFYNCSSLEEIVCSHNLTTIGSKAFGNSSNQTVSVYFSGTESEWNKISISDDNKLLTNATRQCFPRTGYLERRYVGSDGNVTYNLDNNGTLHLIGSGETIAFWSYDEPTPWREVAWYVRDLDIDPRITSIGKYTFSLCPSLQTVTLPDSISDLGPGLFRNCYWLTEVTLPKNIELLHSQFFRECGRLRKVTIPENVTIIFQLAFDNCVSLKTVTLPHSLTLVESNAFLHCNSLTDVYYFGTAADWASIDIEEEGNEALLNANIHYITDEDAGPNMRSRFKEGVLYLTGYGNMYDFEPDDVPWLEYAELITKIDMDDNITSIGNNAFRNCVFATEINLPTSLQRIGNYAFFRNNGLKQLVIPDTVTSIGENAFNWCYNLEYVKLPYGLTEIPSSLFVKCNSLVQVDIPETVTSIGSGAFSQCSSLGNGNYSFPFQITEIKPWAFSSCYGLTEVVLPPNLSAISEGVFNETSSLKVVTLTNKVTSIGENNFINTTLSDVYFYGTQAEWDKIVIGDYNPDLGNATIHCLGNYSCLLTETEGTVSVYFPGTPLAYGLIFNTGDEDFDLNTPGITQIAYKSMSPNHTITFTASEVHRLQPLSQVRAYAVYLGRHFSEQIVYSNIGYVSYNKLA